MVRTDKNLTNIDSEPTFLYGSADLSVHHHQAVVVASLTNRRILAPEQILVQLEIGPDPATGSPAPWFRPGDHLVPQMSFLADSPAQWYYLITLL